MKHIGGASEWSHCSVLAVLVHSEAEVYCKNFLETFGSPSVGSLGGSSRHLRMAHKACSAKAAR